MAQQASLSDGTATRARISTGILGLDDVLHGGLTPDRLYLLEGTPGAGKTTLSLQFLLDGAARGERGLYVTLSETADELRASAATHGWSLDGIELYELVNELGLDPDSEQSILHPSEIELGETVKEVIARVEELKPARVVFDSLSELRLLAQNPLRYRRQILALKQFFARRDCTVLMLDDRTSEVGDVQLHSIAHGVISLEQAPREFGSERRRLRIIKMRGIKFRGGYHDFVLDTGGIRVFPRLIAAEHHTSFDPTAASTGSAELDLLLGGGLVPGTNTLLIGPSGVGKTTTAIRCMLTALERGETATYFLFDEGLATLLTRSALLDMNLAPHIEAGRLSITQIDPAELAPGEFAAAVRTAVEERRSTLVVIDSLNAYLHAMPGDEFLILQMHELLNYLNQQGVTTLLVLGQHGIVGEVRSDIDLSYLSDGILLFRFFEAKGEVRTALSVVKSRVNAHERTIREMRVGMGGLQVGEALSDFEGVLTGLPSYHGKVSMLASNAPPQSDD
ncbi:ATPase domain-containing protein [Methylobacterium longum]|uniref:non-specific serine/threonine protein kinase n=1 Tax=Methylobacterium longum TaxID=767694 RepID=A0ABT8AX53_9HYPH|nr:ATPase domain-containing protein [Methylobacterium longum]MDN3574553.1 gas vesicle protein GvpD [Methylobacterium longum]GJE09336.1 Circadian clock protein kinase KaiC [Methylobacterium longum]